MATSKGNSKLRSTLLKGSDEVFDLACEPCSTVNKHLEAAGYCQTCSEYLCDTCYTCHAKQKVSKHHKLLNKAAMPKQNQTTKVKDVLTKKCLTHTDKVLDHFCNSHEQLCCTTCLKTTHKKCKDTPYIPDISATIDDSSEYIQLQGELDKFVTIATGHQQTIPSKGQVNVNCQAQTLSNIDKTRKQINGYLDNFDKDVKQKASSVFKENSDKIQAASKLCQTVLSEASTMTSDLKDKATSGQNNQLFVLVKLFRARASEIQKHQIQDLEKCDIARFDFEVDEKLEKIKSTLSALWKLSIQQGANVTKATYVKEIGIKCSSDNQDCNICGVAVLTGERMVVTDFANRAVKLFDTNSNKLLSRIKVSTGPGGVIGTESDTVAVGLGNEYKIELMKATNTLSRVKVIHIPGMVLGGFCYFGDMFICACQHLGSVKAIDMSGNLLKVIDKNENGENLFSRPFAVASNPDRSVAYVTDFSAHTVTTITRDAQVVSVYKSNSLMFPAGLAIGRNGEVFVSEAHSIHQLSPNGDFIRVLLGKNQNLAERPGAMCRSEDDNMLYVSSAGHRNQIKIFQLE